MTQSLQEALAATSVPESLDLYSLRECDGGFFVGRKGDGAFVLLGPGQPSMDSTGNAAARFEPWKTLLPIELTEPLRDRSVLEVRVAESLREAVVTVFLGLVATATGREGDFGPAIVSLMPLFAAGLKAQVQSATEVGLLGELLTLHFSPHTGELFSLWHKNVDSRFDFSSISERLDVKTTLGDVREHHFTSRQLEAIPGVCTTFLSVRLRSTSEGLSVASVCEDLSSQLSPQQASRLNSIVIATTGSVPAFVRNVVVDPAPVPTEFWHLDRLDIPTPIGNDEIVSMEWRARVSPGRAPARCAFNRLLGTPSTDLV